MSETPQTIFRFTGEGVDLEFAGSEAFVEKQVAHFRRFLEGAAGMAGAEATEAGDPAPAAAAASAEPMSLEAFAEAHPTRQGRGAIQDRILLYTYFLTNVQGKTDVRGDDLNWCFQKLGHDRPKNLHNALGLLKRKLGMLQEGSGRGLYRLSPKGTSFVEGQFLGR